jgi:hypothetical protein
VVRRELLLERLQCRAHQEPAAVEDALDRRVELAAHRCDAGTEDVERDLSLGQPRIHTATAGDVGSDAQ